MLVDVGAGAAIGGWGGGRMWMLRSGWPSAVGGVGGRRGWSAFLRSSNVANLLITAMHFWLKDLGFCCSC